MENADETQSKFLGEQVTPRGRREREREMQIALKNHFVYQWFSQRADDTKRVRLSGASATTELVKAAW